MTDSKIQIHKTPKGLTGLKVIYRHYKNNARKRNLIFEFSVLEFSTITQHNCTYCGLVPSSVIAGHPKHYKSEETYINSAYIYNGLDRLDNAEGYTLTNCVPCCSICNHAKATMSLSEFLNWIERLTNFRRSK